MNVEWLGELLGHMVENDLDRVVTTDRAAEAWSTHLEEVFQSTLLTEGTKVGSWYLGANIPGKPRKVLFYFGGTAAYAQAWNKVRDNDFDGFTLSSTSSASALTGAIGWTKTGRTATVRN